MSNRDDYEVFDLGDFNLTEGATLRGAKLAYKTYGTLNEAGDNAIVYPTWYSGRHWENEWLIGEGMALDPARYFIVVPNMLGNGLSTSPSNAPPPYDKARFPDVRVQDNVRAQHKLVTEHFGIERLVAVTGWSMGAGQTFQWAVSHPEMVPRILPFCGSARTSRHNQVFLEGIRAAITCDGRGGTPSSPPAASGRPRVSTRGGASPRPSTGTRSTARWATPRWRTSWSASGRVSSSTTATRTTSSPCWGPGRPATWGRPPGSTATPRRR